MDEKTSPNWLKAMSKHLSMKAAEYDKLMETRIWLL